jgi:hypothetical protein
VQQECSRGAAAHRQPLVGCSPEGTLAALLACCLMTLAQLTATKVLRIAGCGICQGIMLLSTSSQVRYSSATPPTQLPSRHSTPTLPPPSRPPTTSRPPRSCRPAALQPPLIHHPAPPHCHPAARHACSPVWTHTACYRPLPCRSLCRHRPSILGFDLRHLPPLSSRHLPLTVWLSCGCRAAVQGSGLRRRLPAIHPSEGGSPRSPLAGGCW